MSPSFGNVNAYNSRDCSYSNVGMAAHGGGGGSSKTRSAENVTARVMALRQTEMVKQTSLPKPSSYTGCFSDDDVDLAPYKIPCG